MPDPTPERAANLLVRAMESWGSFWVGIFEFLGGISLLLLDVAKWIWRAMGTNRVRIGRSAMTAQMVRIGCRSIGIVCLVCGCIGLILALQMEPPLGQFGQQDKIANIVGVAVLRELGPLISAIVLTGFAGASIAAEIGTMVVGEEIEALQAHGLNPVRFLAVPRVLATTLSLVLLTVIGDVVALLSAGFVAIQFLGVPYQLYVDNTFDQVVAADFLTGLLKASVFGLILAAVACHNGLKVSGGAAGVGKATTDTVVQTIVSVIIADLAFTTVFFQLGWN